MYKPYKFLYILFGAISIYHTGLFAEDLQPCNPSNVSRWLDSGTSVRTLCDKGYYLESCAGYKIGTNWLKPITLELEEEQCQTKGYYSTDSDDNMEHLRMFFANDASTDTDKNLLLSYFCTNDDGKLLDITCSPCPNGGTTDAESYVNTDSTGKINWTSWHVNSIANCFMQEFSDNSGTYVFVPSNVELNSAGGIPCYYSTDVPGTKLN